MTGQAEFRAALLDPGHAPPKGLRNPGGEQATKRFDVYRNNVAVSLTEALETAFPVVRRLVGDEFFHAMSGIYLRAHPPSSPLMMFYGDDMPAFLEGFEPAKSVPYLADMARLELALRESYHAADATPLPPDALAQIPPDTLPRVTFAFAPATRLVPSRYPLHSIWLANTQGGQNTKNPEPTLVTRPQLDPQVDALTPPQAAVTQALMDGVPLGEAIKHGGAGFDLGPLLGVLLGRNAITALKT